MLRAARLRIEKPAAQCARKFVRHEGAQPGVLRRNFYFPLGVEIRPTTLYTHGVTFKGYMVQHVMEREGHTNVKKSQTKIIRFPIRKRPKYHRTNTQNHSKSYPR